MFAVFVDYTDFAGANPVVNADKGLGCTFIECDGTPPKGFARLPPGRPGSPRTSERTTEYSIGPIWSPREDHSKPPAACFQNALYHQGSGFLVIES